MKREHIIKELYTFVNIQIVFIIVMVVKGQMWTPTRLLAATLIAYAFLWVFEIGQTKRGKKNG